MGMIGKGILALFWLVLVPLFGGVPFFYKKEKKMFPGECLAAGYACLFTLFETLTLPMILLDLPLHVLTAAYGTGAAALALGGGFCLYRRRTSGICGKAGKGRTVRIKNVRDEKGRYIGETAREATAGKRFSDVLPMLAAVVLIAAQIAAVVYYAHMDADDAFYVGTATTAVETDTIFSVNPYTGAAYEALPSRYVLSPFPVFLAVVSNLSGGLHPAVMAHMLFPAVFVALGYVALLLLARYFYPENLCAQGTFLLIAASAIWFSGYSIYNSGNFEMVRVWQGKALLAGVFLPLLFYWCLTDILKEKPRDSRLLPLLGNAACCLLSSMGILLAPLLMGIFLFLSLIKYRSLKRSAAEFCCVLPSLALGCAYLWIR